MNLESTTSSNYKKRTAMLDMKHLLRELLMQRYKMFIMGNNITCSIYCNHILAATLYALQTWLFQVRKCKYTIKVINIIIIMIIIITQG